MGQAHRGEAPALEPLDHPDLPEWSSAVERSLEQARDERLELLVRTRARNRDVTQVVVEVEVPIVDPHRVLLAGNPGEPLPIAGNPVEDALDPAPDGGEVDAAALPRQRAGAEDLGGAAVHGTVRLLPGQKVVVLCGEAFVLVVALCHGSPRSSGGLHEATAGRAPPPPHPRAILRWVEGRTSMQTP
jgi:hypothetical protein